MDGERLVGGTEVAKKKRKARNSKIFWTANHYGKKQGKQQRTVGRVPVVAGTKHKPRSLDGREGKV